MAGLIDNKFYREPDITRLIKAISNDGEPDYVPILEYWTTSEQVMQYVLDGKARFELMDNGSKESNDLVPEDAIEYAKRIGMDAIRVNFSWNPAQVFKKAQDGTIHYVDGQIKSKDDLEKLGEPPDITKQLQKFERYLQAVEKSGTKIGVYPSITGFFDCTYLAIGFQDFLFKLYDDIELIETLMDIFVENQRKLVEEVVKYHECSFVFINDDIAFGSGLIVRPELFKELYLNRMKALVEPAKKARKLLTYHTDGKLDQVFPILDEIGFDAVHPIEPGANNIYELKKAWGQKICLHGNIETVLLAYGEKQEIQQDVIKHISKVAPGGGYILGSSSSIMEGIPPENYLAMIECAMKYGKYSIIPRGKEES